MSPGGERCWAVLPAAGTGSRMGAAVPKQYLQVAGVTLLELSLRALLACRQVSGVVVTLQPQDTRAQALDMLSQPGVRWVAGGAQRSDSVLAGLRALADQADPRDWVLVHDAARPCLQVADIDRLVAQVVAAGIGGILAEPIVDTVKRAGEDGLVAGTLDRKSLWRAQTPQMFRLAELRQALESAAQQGVAVTDEASAMELACYPVQLVAGSPSNLKVTLPQDLDLARWYLEQRSGSRQT